MFRQIIIFSLVCASARAADAPAPEIAAAEATLTKKGLSRAGNRYLLPTDADLPELLRAMRAAKAKTDGVVAKRAQLEKQIEQATDALQQALADCIAADKRLAAGKNLEARRYNELGAAVRAADARKVEAARVVQARVKEFSKLGHDGLEDYVGLAVALGQRMEVAAKHYETLAADAEVTAAIATLNTRPGAKTSLGPSPAFAEELKGVLQTKKLLDAGIIRLTIEGGVPHAMVSINGHPGIKMVVDSGAASILLSAARARELNVRPAKDAKIVLSQGADGKVFESRLVMLDSIRVGQFTIKNVECRVLPDSMEGSNLLGGMFLRNFVFRIDLTAKVLHLVPTSEQVIDETATDAPDPNKLQGIVIDDLAAKLTGKWTTGSSMKGYVGTRYIYDEGNKGECFARFEFKVPQSGKYEVRLRYAAHENRTTKAPVKIVSMDGEQEKTINMTRPGSLPREFISLGVYNFDAATVGAVVVSNKGTTGYVCVDAVQLLPEK